MLFLRSIINFFFVPVLALYYFLREDITIKKGFENYPKWTTMLLQYIVIIVCNIPLTRVFTFALRIVTGMEVEADSSYYTVAALAAAFIMPNIYAYFQRIREIIRTEKDVEESEQQSCVCDDDTTSDKEEL